MAPYEPAAGTQAGTDGRGVPHDCDMEVVYASDLEAYNFGRSHPLQPHRYRLTFDLLEGLGLLDGPSVSVVPPRDALVSELLRVHTYPYLQAVRRAENIAKRRAKPADLSVFGLGSLDNPYFPAIYEASSLAAGASLMAMEALLEGDALHAYNMAGGLHHAMRARAAGFCIFNDAALAIQAALDAERRVAYVDFDAHHGDGVQAAFYDNPGVLTVSVHESGRFLFPGTGGIDERGQGAGLGTSVNIPLPPRAGDEAFLFALETIIAPAVEAFRPDVLVTQTGCDTHWSDPLTHLGATLRLYPELGGRLHRLAHDAAGGRWLILGGGGYDPVSITPRAWAGFFAGAVGHLPPPDRLPHSYLVECRSRGVPEPAGLLDDPGPEFEPLGTSAVEHLVGEFRDNVLPGLARLGASV